MSMTNSAENNRQGWHKHNLEKANIISVASDNKHTA